MLQGKREFADILNAKDLKIGRVAMIIQGDPT